MIDLDSNQLYIKYGTFIKKVCYSLTKEFSWALDKGEAEQIAWEAAMRSYPKYQAVINQGVTLEFETYVYKRIRGAVRDDIRRRTGRRVKGNDEKRVFISEKMDSLDAMEDSTYERLVGYTEDPEEFFKPSFEEIIEPIKDKKQANILRLLYLHELTLSEIGTIYGVSESRIGQIYKESLFKIRRYKEMYGEQIP